MLLTPLTYLESTVKDFQNTGKPAREYLYVILVWLAVSVILTTLAWRNLASVGLYYDEALFAGLAKDFIVGNIHGVHIPGTQTVNLFGHPFPLFVQSYFGAVKIWLLIPSFMIFGPSIPVLRLTALFWCLIGLLIFMLWTRRLLGLPAALIATPLLGLDPSFFYISLFDWGGVTQSFLCKVCGFFLIILWWQKRKTHYFFFAAFFFGLGFLHKIDCVVVLLGCGISVIIMYWKEVLAAIHDAPGTCAWCCLGFLLGAGLAPLKILTNLQTALGGNPSRNGSEIQEKINTTCAMYDGSYFSRLMNAGGKFDEMFSGPPTVWSPFGVLLICSIVFMTFEVVRGKGATSTKQVSAFLLLCLLFTTIGVFLLPGAVRMHHSTLVYPFPHLIVAATLITLWEITPAEPVIKYCIRTFAAGIAVTLIISHLSVIWKTQNIMHATGGRGWWSDSISVFCNDIKGQKNLSIISLDWGFNEQLSFLTDEVQLTEPFWNNERLTITDNTIYLVHPPEYSLFPYGLDFFYKALQESPDNVSIQPYKDHQGGISFYAIRFFGK